ncbi:prenyltransferase [Gracilibacillus phocaeensis]|uniref:prenyltransferase n=1 Tax=Gracilibacillus phocaeensis TaxID=2042304 RepID=UPI001031E2BF|nr:prenyltransferase [Gracilibacillus phocaeensis]
MTPVQAIRSFKGIGMLLRLVAVIFSSVAALLSATLPLMMHYSLSWFSVGSTFMLLLIGAIVIHGGLTHALNDIADHQSGTDQVSPGILSGGSRVIQTNTLPITMLKQLGLWLSLVLLLAAFLFAVFDYREFAILTLVGVWGAVFYSMRPLQLSYLPFAGEWLSLFPAMLLLGIAMPWVILDHLPVWAWQNALVNAVWCMAWVMFHHIPDREADRQAKPMKRTSVVWAIDRFGSKWAIFPAILYFLIVGSLCVWIAFTRPIAAIGAVLILLYAIRIVQQTDIDDIEELTKNEKQLLVLAMATALWLGFFSG